MSMDYDKPIFRKLSNVSHLPSLPSVLLKLIQTCNRDSAGLADVAAIVETDPSLSSRILRLVNSAHYALPYRVESMRQAVNLIGMSTIKNLALCASVQEVFRDTKSDTDLNLKAFWWHSLRCGLLAKRLAEANHYEKPEEAFLCGLFHDIGKLVLWTHFGGTYTRILSDGGKGEEGLLTAELRLGATHPEVGAWLLNQWGLPSFMSDGILYHHEPRSRIAGAFPLVKIVYCAHEICAHATDGEQPEAGIEAAVEILEMSRREAQSALGSADAALEDVAKVLQIEVEAPRPAEEGGGDPGAVREELTREVRDLSLLKGTLESLLVAQTRADILRVLLEGVQILFDKSRALFFLYDDNRDAYVCSDPSEKQQLFSGENNAIPADLSRSLVVRSMEAGTPIHSHAGDEPFPLDRPIVDDQVIRHLGKDGIFCLPMRASGEPVGVLVLSMADSEQSFFLQHANVLNLFAQQGALALFTERLKRKHYEDIQKERLSAIYTFARKVAHEVKSPLSIIKNYLHILGMKTADQNIAQDEIRILHEEIDRVSSILEQLSNMSDSNETQDKERIDVNRMLTELAKIMKESLHQKAGVTLLTRLDPDLPSVSASRNALKQVFINLIRNAVEAMKNGGELMLRTRRNDAGSGDGESRSSNGQDEMVEIEVSDNGDGVPESLRSRLFEPFVGSKQEGHSGLGLSIVHGLVDSCGGEVSCEDKPGGGTTFRILLPAEKT